MDSLFGSESMALPIVGILALFFSWRLAALTKRRVRRLVTWIETHLSESWRALPGSYRFFPTNGVAYLCRKGLSTDPEFITLCEEFKRTRRRYYWFLLLVFLPIFAILLGVRYLGWSW